MLKEVASIVAAPDAFKSNVEEGSNAAVVDDIVNPAEAFKSNVVESTVTGLSTAVPIFMLVLLSKCSAPSASISTPPPDPPLPPEILIESAPVPAELNNKLESPPPVTESVRSTSSVAPVATLINEAAAVFTVRAPLPTPSPADVASISKPPAPVNIFTPPLA